MRLATEFVVWATMLIAPASAEPIIILIGGNHSDPSPAQLAGRTGRGGNSGLWRLKQDLLVYDKLQAEYFNWNGTRAGRIDHLPPPGAAGIADVIRERRAQRPEAPVIIVGNSWGGHTAWQVCRILNGQDVALENGGQKSVDAWALSAGTPVEETPPAADVTVPVPANDHDHAQSGEDDSTNCNECTSKRPGTSSEVNRRRRVEVELVVFLDPSSFGRTKEPNPTVLPVNVSRAVNYFTRNSFSWSAWPGDPRITNVDLGDPANGFLDPGGPKYGAALNWGAHVAAEWDERIHADIRQRIRAAIRLKDDSPQTADPD